MRERLSRTAGGLSADAPRCYAVGSAMVRWKARTFDHGPDRVVVRQHDGVIELMAGGLVLLSSAALETERSFGRLVGCGPRRRVVIGGLGFGVTLRGVLDVAGPDAEITVVEKVAIVEELVRRDLAHVSDHALDDSRVTLVRGDVGDVIAQQSDLSAILLDVDNGPHWASFRSNARLYTPAGLAMAHRALAAEGRLAVWSGYRADAFLRSLAQAGFIKPSAVPLHERGRVRARAYVGEKPARRT